jgi:hypothetical protein
MTVVLMLLALSAQPAAPLVALDDPSASYCLATGFCRRQPGPPVPSASASGRGPDAGPPA